MPWTCHRVGNLLEPQELHALLASVCLPIWWVSTMLMSLLMAMLVCACLCMWGNTSGLCMLVHVGQYIWSVHACACGAIMSNIASSQLLCAVAPEFCDNQAEKSENLIKVSMEWDRLDQERRQQARASAKNQLCNEMWRRRPVLKPGAAQCHNGAGRHCKIIARGAIDDVLRYREYGPASRRYSPEFKPCASTSLVTAVKAALPLHLPEVSVLQLAWAGVRIVSRLD
eukprot:363721-Chlamydomonas_euryale.AAC.5